MVLPTCCALRTHRDFWAAAQGQADQLPRDGNPNILLWVWSQMRNYNSQEGTEARKHTTYCARREEKVYQKAG